MSHTHTYMDMDMDMGHPCNLSTYILYGLTLSMIPVLVRTATMQRGVETLRSRTVLLLISQGLPCMYPACSVPTTMAIRNKHANASCYLITDTAVCKSIVIGGWACVRAAIKDCFTRLQLLSTSLA